MARSKITGGEAKRHKPQLRKDRIEGVSTMGIRRMARRGGVKRMAGTIYPRCRSTMMNYLTNIVRDSLVHMQHARRKTVFVKDVHAALRLNNRVLYGPVGHDTPKRKTVVVAVPEE
jgi:histone H4